jgi:hypothetical protein
MLTSLLSGPQTRNAGFAACDLEIPLLSLARATGAHHIVVKRGCAASRNYIAAIVICTCQWELSKLQRRGASYVCTQMQLPTSPSRPKTCSSRITNSCKFKAIINEGGFHPTHAGKASQATSPPRQNRAQLVTIV